MLLYYISTIICIDKTYFYIVKSYQGDEMKTIFTEYDEKESFYVVSYGTE